MTHASKVVEKEIVKKELEKIYDSNVNLWLSTGSTLKNRFVKTLDDSPILKTLLKITIIATVGIYTLLAMFLIFWNTH